MERISVLPHTIRKQSCGQYSSQVLCSINLQCILLSHLLLQNFGMFQTGLHLYGCVFVCLFATKGETVWLISSLLSLPWCKHFNNLHITLVSCSYLFDRLSSCQCQKVKLLSKWKLKKVTRIQWATSMVEWQRLWLTC